MPDYTMKNYYNSGEFEKGIEYATDPNNRSSFTEWDYLFLSKCMYKIRRYSDYLDLYKEFHAKYPDSDKLDDNMGWSLYQSHIKGFDFDNGDKRQYLKQIDYILAHCTDSQYSPKVWIATLAADNIFKQKLGANPNYELADKYLSMIDPTQLDLTERENTVDGRTMRTASDREKWYNHKTKALIELEEYEKCLEYIAEAFQNVDRFHNNCEHWLNYRKAICYLELCDIDSAEEIIKKVLSRFEHWCFYEILFKIAVRRGNVEDAIKYCAVGATVDREHKLRVTFYENFAEFLFNNGYNTEAALHYKLVELVRAEEAWKGIRLPDGFSYPSDVASLDKNGVIRQLEKYWNTEKERGIDFYEGTISKVLPNGRSGFISDGVGKSYYFNVRDFTRKVYDLAEGARVRYALAERLDKSKNEVKLNAVQISFVK